MNQKKSKATRRSISILQQIVTGFLPGWKIAEFAANEKIKAREFSYDAQIYLLMLGQLLHLFSLNELVDVSQIYASELSRIRGIAPAKLNTFSNANRTRNPDVIEKFFWYVYEMLKKDNPGFVQCPCKGPLAKFRSRGIYAIDSSTIRLAYWCIGWAKHRQKKAAVKLHMVANVRSRLPHFCLIDKARVLIEGRWRDMVFLTNNFVWSATTIAELYKARWEVELLFKELKQTLQLQDFYGENENAVKWQIWAALLTHLLLRFLKFKAKANCSYTRFVGFVRAVVWLKKDLMSVLRAYGIAPGGNEGDTLENMPYLLGFEKYFAAAVG